MSGTSIVSKWHSVSFRILLSVTSTAFSTFSDKCHRSGWGREICGWQPRACFVCSGQLGWNQFRQKQSRWKQSVQKQNGQTEGSTSLDKYTMGHWSPCCIYCVMSLSEVWGVLSGRMTYPSRGVVLRYSAAHELKPLSETPQTPNFWPSSAVHSLITVYLNISTYYLFYESSCNL